MHLCFIDESGNPPTSAAKISPNHKYFVLAAVVIPDAQWSGISSEIKSLKARPEYNVVGEIKWRYFGSNNDSKNNLLHLTSEQRNAFRKDLYTILTRRKSVKIISCVTDIEKAYAQSYISCVEDLYYYTYKTIAERFQYLLQDISRETGSEQSGLIICDHREVKDDNRLRSDHHFMTDTEAPFTSDMKNIIETILFAPSHMSVGIQLADMVAGGVYRDMNLGREEYVPLFRSSFRSSRSGVIEGYGLVRFPKK